MAIIKTRNLIKNYGDLVAVDNVNLDIKEQECFGLLGPNGAGKTSLVRMISAVSPPTNGYIKVLDWDLRSHSRQVKAVLGVVPQIDNLDPELTVIQNLVTFARYFDIPRAEAVKRSIELLKLFHLEDRSNSRLRELSGGMRRRLLIVRALINQPRIMILDEPTIGLDPQTKYLVWHKLTELKSQGVTQLLCTQNMEEASRLCDRVAIMHQGKIVSLDTPANLLAKYVGNKIWEIELDSNKKDMFVIELKRRGLDFELVGHKVHIFHLENSGPLETLVGSLEKLSCRTATLEDVFFRLTGRTLME